MIPRYSRPEMVKIWQDENKYAIWLEIEVLAAEKMADLGIIPKESPINTRKKAKFSIERIAQIEAITKHDVIAFLTNIAENVGEDARFLHQGMTSSDVLDTCLNYQLKQAGDILMQDMDKLLEALKTRAFEHKLTPCIGRSHGIHAEPTSFGVKLASYYAEFSRLKTNLQESIAIISTCAISGAVGSFANVPPEVEAFVAQKLGLAIEPISTQIINRDRHARYFTTLALIASSMERLATEIRHLQRSEVGEAEEFFSKGQKGSSAMPHKRNPVLSENITGLARLIRSYAIPAMENVALWHERDISHSSVERIIAPSATITLDFALNRLANIVAQLVIYPNKMLENLNKFKGLHDSGRVLLLLTQHGISREDAYKIVQTSAMEAWQNNLEFQEVMAKNPELNKLCPDLVASDEFKNSFNLSYHLAHVDEIFARVFDKNN